MFLAGVCVQWKCSHKNSVHPHPPVLFIPGDQGMEVSHKGRPGQVVRTWPTGQGHNYKLDLLIGSKTYGTSRPITLTPGAAALWGRMMTGCVSGADRRKARYRIRKQTLHACPSNCQYCSAIVGRIGKRESSAVGTVAKLSSAMPCGKLLFQNNKWREKIWGINQWQYNDWLLRMKQVHEWSQWYNLPEHGSCMPQENDLLMWFYRGELQVRYYGVSPPKMAFQLLAAAGKLNHWIVPYNWKTLCSVPRSTIHITMGSSSSWGILVFYYIMEENT